MIMFSSAFLCCQGPKTLLLARGSFNKKKTGGVVFFMASMGFQPKHSCALKSNKSTEGDDRKFSSLISFRKTGDRVRTKMGWSPKGHTFRSDVFFVSREAKLNIPKPWLSRNSWILDNTLPQTNIAPKNGGFQ